MAQAILFDADGVTLVKHSYFSEKLSKEHNIPLEKIIPFFRGEFRITQAGKADLKEALPKYLQEWGWQKSLDDFLKYWFIEDTLPDMKVINTIQGIRAKGIKCYLASDQEKYRAQYLLSELNFANYFDRCFFSYELGYSKSEKEFFEKVLAQINLQPEELIYWDDDQENLGIAKQLGINAKLFVDINDVIKELGQ